MTSAWVYFCELYRVPEMFRGARTEDFDGPGYRGTIKEFSDVWVSKQRSAVLHGLPGKGKTRCIYALIRQIVDFYGVIALRFFNSTELDERLLREFNEFGAIDGVMEMLCSVPYLFVDDFGTERTSERVFRNTQFLVDHRWKMRRPLILSTNLTSGEIRDRYGDRVFDRLQDADWVNFSAFADWRGLDANHPH